MSQGSGEAPAVSEPPVSPVSEPPGPPGPPSSPFVGLRPYTGAEASLFFGRERERRVVSSNLRASRLTLLYGPSGVGKSSMLNAAVVPHLRAIAADQAAEGERPPFTVVVFRSWRDDPVAGLIRCLAEEDEGRAGEETQVRAGDSPLVAALRSRAQGRGEDLLVVLDQFEEYFLYHGDKGGRDGFARQFSEAVNDRGLRTNFLLSFREDALSGLDLFKGRIPRLFGNYLRVGYLDAEGARRAIHGPVEHFNRVNPDATVEVEPALVENVLSQVEAGKVVVGRAGAGSVPAASDGASPRAIETSHLQMVLARLWSEEAAAGSRVLRASTLERLGGSAEIVKGHVDRELSSLSDHDQDVAAAAFEHLVTPSGTKIAHSTADLAILSDATDPELGEVVRRLSAGTSRILRTVEPAPGRSDERYEIFHDVLAAAILDWRARHEQRKDRAAAEAELRRQRQEADERARAARRRARNLSLFSLVTALLVIALVLALTAQRQKHAARSRQQAAEALSYMSVDPLRSVRGALDALDTAPTREAESALRQAVAGTHVRSVMSGHRDWVNTVAFDPSGRSLVTASSDGTARTWDVATGTERSVLQGHGHWVATGVSDASGRLIVTASADGTARLWDAASGTGQRTLVPEDHQRHALVTASFDPAGKVLVTAGNDGLPRLWDATSGVQLRRLEGHSGLVTSASFESTGARLVTAGADGTVRVWDTGTGEERARFDQHDDRVVRAVFSPDGALVATAGQDGKAFLWRWESGEAVALSGHTDRLVDVEFARRGDLVVTAGDKTARVWDTATGVEIADLRGHSDRLTAAVFSSDGRLVATAGQDGSARVWDVATETAVVELHGHQEIVWDVAFSPIDDRVLATAGSDGTARLWELPEQLTLPHPEWVLAAEFSADGRSVVTSGQDGTARIWDADTGRQEKALSGHKGHALASLSADGGLVATVDDGQARIWDRRGGDRPFIETSEVRRGLVRFTPSGDSVVVSDEDGTVYRWDWKVRAPVRRLTGYRGAVTVTDMDLSADGRWLVTAGSDRVARVWDVDTGREALTLRGHDGVVYSARFSSDGAFVVTSSADGTARIWDTETGAEVRALVADRGLRSAAFDPAGDRIVAGAVDGSIRIWDAHSGRTLSVLATHTNAVNTVEYSPDGLRILSASDDGTAAIFTCPTCEDLGSLRARAEQRLREVGRPPERTVNGWSIAPGVCYERLANSAAVVDCRSAHESEAFAVLEHPAGYGVPFDDEAVKAYARQECEGERFADYVGVPLSSSRYDVSVWTPNAGTWDSGDRRIVCSVYGNAELTGSVRGARR